MTIRFVTALTCLGLALTAGCADEPGAGPAAVDSSMPVPPDGAAPGGDSAPIDEMLVATLDPADAVTDAGAPSGATTDSARATDPDATAPPADVDDPVAGSADAGCTPLPDVVRDYIAAELQANGATLIAGAAWPLVRPRGITDLWAMDLDAVRVQAADGTETTAVFLSAAYLLSGQWSSAVGDQMNVYAVDAGARSVSTLPAPDPAVVNRVITEDDPNVALARTCLP